MKKLILASSSPTRKKLLAEAGFCFEVDPSDYEENMTLSVPPKELVMRLSKGKTEDVARRHKEKDFLVSIKGFFVLATECRNW